MSSTAIMNEMAYAKGGYKICSRCKENKSIDEFTKNRSEKDGLFPYCRECKIIYDRAHWAENADRKNAKRRAERAANLSKFRLLDQERYERDKERILERMANEYNIDPTRHKKNAAIRRARQMGQFVEPVDPKIVYEMHGGMRGICEKFVDYSEFEVDHVIPLSKGGMHGYVNVQPAHFKCNRSKGAKIL